MEVKRTRVRREIVEAAHTRLRSLPAYEPDEMTMTEAVRRLLPDIHALQKKGYSLDAVADVLREEGMAISGAGLKALMRHALDAKMRLKARRPTAPGGRGRDGTRPKTPASELPRAVPSAADVGSASGHPFGESRS